MSDRTSFKNRQIKKAKRIKRGKLKLKKKTRYQNIEQVIKNPEIIMICTECVYKESLKDFIRSNGDDNICSYCKNNECCVDDDILSKFILDKTNSFLVNTDELSSHDHTTIFIGGSDTPANYTLWGFFEPAGDEIACEEFLESFVESLPSDTDEKGNYILFCLNDGTLDELNAFEDRWVIFNRSIRHAKRFYNKEAEEFCKDLFDSSVEDNQLIPDLITNLDQSVSLFRARIAYNKDEIEKIADNPISELGPVPPQLATSQRMTPEGVSAFYGAFDRDTCVSELRPMVGDAVVSCEFNPNDELKLLDLDALCNLEPPSDYFSDSYINISHARVFFKELKFQLTRPSSHSGKLDHLASQFIFEYIYIRFGDQVHGLKYSSVQNNGATDCVVLFPQHSHVDKEVPLRDVRATAEKEESSLKFTADSLRFHRIKQAAYNGSTHDSHYDLTMDDRTARLLFPSARY